MKLVLILLIALLSYSNHVYSKKVKIDQMPMYDGIDRNANPKLKKRDKKFIAKMTKKHGNIQNAAKVLADQGFEYIEMGNDKKAMQRFNQAWLLDSDYADVYWGFSTILYEQGDNCGAMKIGHKALDARLSSLIPPKQNMLFAKLGMVTSVCAMDDSNDEKNKALLIKKADDLFVRAENIWPSAYLYDMWWQGLYWRGEYEKSWDKVFLMRENGGEPVRDFLIDLKIKMREPKK
ncbi:MAG: type IV pilus biogenesis/stability protein PilW [Marinicellaceae bacterium]